MVNDLEQFGRSCLTCMWLGDSRHIGEDGYCLETGDSIKIAGDNYCEEHWIASLANRICQTCTNCGTDGFCPRANVQIKDEGSTCSDWKIRGDL